MNNKPGMIANVYPEQLSKMVEGYESAFIKLIHERIGILVRDHQRQELHKIIMSACQKFDCLPADYFQKLMTAPDQSPILEHLVTNITVGETYFFRDKKQTEFLRQILLPELIETKRQEGNLSLRIWSAGCASGEEIYTIAMLLRALIKDLQAWTLTLLATDINTLALKKAISGVYTEWSMRSIPKDFKERYFSMSHGLYQLDKEIRQMVKFDYFNLNTDLYPSILTGTNAQDLILCRNVLIYFDQKHIAHIMKKFSHCLVPGGFLLLGASDPVDIKDTSLVFHHDKGQLFSRAVVEPLVATKEKVNIKQKSPTPPIKRREKAKTIDKKYTEIKINEALINQLLNTSQWHETLQTIETYSRFEQSAFLMNAKAIALANLGRLDAALICIEKSIELDATDKNKFFTYAMTLIELNQLVQAEEALRKTLFLDRQFVVGHYQLGLLLLRNNQKQAGIKSLSNALSIAAIKKYDEPVAGSPGLSYGQLSEILKHEIEIYTDSGKHYAHQDKDKQKA